jgi:uncharacterized protein (TIGR02268 family)
MMSLITCRAPGRVVVRAELKNPDDAAPWTTRGARLTGPKGEALSGSVWQSAPILPGETGIVFIEVQAGDARTVAPFLLKLWEEDGPRVVTLGNVTFPAFPKEPAF